MTVVQPPLSLPIGKPQQSIRAEAGAQMPEAIEIARVVLVIGLVFLHYFAFPNSRTSPFTGLDPAHHPFATFVNSFVLLFFFSAVPLLSAISGWLFFNLASRPMTVIRRRIHGRVSSLLLPLVVWNLLTLLVGYALYRVAPTTGLLGDFNFSFGQANLFDHVNAVLGLTRLPIAFQFWFVHDLFLTVLVSPLLWLMLRSAPLTFATLLGVAWVCEWTFGIFVRTDVLFFFYLGGLLRLRSTPLDIEWVWAKRLLLAYCVLMAARAMAPLVIDPTVGDNQYWLDLATRLARPLGVAACWGLCLQLVGTGLGGMLARYGGFAFFLHAAHFPIIAGVKFVLWRAVPAETDAWMLAHYAASVTVTIAIAALAAVAIFKVSPALYSFLAGGRRLA